MTAKTCGLIHFSYWARWATADFKLGDVVIFPMLTFHGSLVNTVPGQLRLNADVRYQPASHPVDPRYSGCVWSTPKLRLRLWSSTHLEPAREVRLREQAKGATVAEAKTRWGLTPWPRPAL